MEECGQLSPTAEMETFVPDDPNPPNVVQDLSGQLGGLQLNACRENPQKEPNSRQRKRFVGAERKQKPSIKTEQLTQGVTFFITVSVPRPGNTKIALLKPSDDHCRERITCGQPFSIKLDKGEVVCWLNKTAMKELCAAGFSQEMSQEKLAQLFYDYLSVNIGVEVVEMHELGRRVLKNLELSCLEKCIIELLPKHLRSSVEIRLHSSASDGKVEGEVHCKDDVSTREAAKFLEYQEICLDWNFPPHQRLPLLSIETKLKIQFRLPAAVFRTTQEWFRYMFCIEGVTHTVTNVNSLDSLEFQGSNFGSIEEAVMVLNRMLRGKKIGDASRPVSLEQVAEAVKAAVSANKIYMYCKPQTIRLIGEPEDIQEAVDTLGNCIRETDQCNRKNLVLVSEEFSMLRSFLAMYGDNLSKLAEEWELCGVEFHPNLKSIEVTGTESAIEKAEKLMQKLPKSALHASGESCPVCGLPSMTSQKGISLESCGHWHCILCLLLALKVAPLPLACFNTTCRKPWIHADISNVTKNRTSLLSEYAQRSAYFGITEDSSSQGQLCPTPECDFVWSSENCSESQKSVTYREGPICSKCTNAVCLRCRSLFHYGMSCAAFMASLGSDSDTESDTRSRTASERSSSPAWPGLWEPGSGRNEKWPLLPAEVWRLGKGVYKMTRKPRGFCIIINNYDFGYEFLNNREGSQVDVERMEELFEALYFSVQSHSNLTARGMEELLKEVAAEKQQRNAECLVVVLSSHGHEQGLYGSDMNRLDLQKIYDLFDNNNCPALQGKPKLFFIQACRGDECDFGAPLTDEVDAIITGEHSRSSVHNEGRRVERMATRSDMYIAHSTTPGSVSFRNTFSGSWYLHNVYKVFSSHAWKLPLRQLLGQVRQEVMQLTAHNGYKQTPWLEECGGAKELYFNPGCRL